MSTNRRQFATQTLGSLAAFGLVELLWSRDLFADAVKPTLAGWLKDLADMTNDLRGRKLSDVEFQTKMEELFRRVNLPELLAAVKLDEIDANLKLPDNGAANPGVDFSKIEGLPALRLGKQIFGCKKGRSIVPHGHSNMCTGFIILKGDWQGKHYDKVETAADHYLIRPTVDRQFGPGEVSTISDHKDNVHWFKALSEKCYIFNVHVVGYDPSIKGISSRLYLDPDGERIAGGLIKAPKMTSKACHEKYG